jgi:hypothetical protein
MSNGLKTYQNTTFNFSVEITADTTTILSGYTAYMAIDFITGITIVTGTTIIDGTTIFSLSNAINDVKPYVYEYEIYIENEVDRYTIIQDSYSILPSIS